MHLPRCFPLSSVFPPGIESARQRVHISPPSPSPLIDDSFRGSFMSVTHFGVRMERRREQITRGTSRAWRMAHPMRALAVDGCATVTLLIAQTSSGRRQHGRRGRERGGQRVTGRRNFVKGIARTLQELEMGRLLRRGNCR